MCSSAINQLDHISCVINRSFIEIPMIPMSCKSYPMISVTKFQKRWPWDTRPCFLSSNMDGKSQGFKVRGFYMMFWWPYRVSPTIIPFIVIIDMKMANSIEQKYLESMNHSQGTNSRSHGNVHVLLGFSCPETAVPHPDECSWRSPPSHGHRRRWNSNASRTSFGDETVTPLIKPGLKVQMYTHVDK